MIISVFTISIIGTILHFLYDISKHNKVVGLFSSVNESTWEHIKIALTPSFLWGIVDGFKYGAFSNYFSAKFISLLSIIVVIPFIYYLYKFVFKKNILFVDISIFYIAIIISQLLFRMIVNFGNICYIYNYISCILLFILFGFYMVVTLFPVKNFIFRDPITNKYGFNGHL